MFKNSKNPKKSQKISKIHFYLFYLSIYLFFCQKKKKKKIAIPVSNFGFQIRYTNYMPQNCLFCSHYPAISLTELYPCSLKEAIKNVALIWVFYKQGPTPPPPSPGIFRSFGALFRWLNFFKELFGPFLFPNSPTTYGTSA